MKAYQQKYKFTNEDIEMRDNRLIQAEYDLEEATNQLESIKSKNNELVVATNTLRDDYDQLMEQKRNAEKEMTRLEEVISELQMNLTSSHQHLKKEVSRVEAHSAELNNQLEESERRAQALAHQLDKSNQSCKKLEDQVDSLRSELMDKSNQVSLNSWAQETLETWPYHFLSFQD